ncbi:MAG TPA: GNAT family N-acetyltransferase [Phycisphaerae bacterium]|nr:GNAT family N-acetyltransferase [Phycisphaerae bacterium]
MVATMTHAAEIHPVPEGQWREALHFLAGGGDHSLLTDARTENLETMIGRRDPETVRMWWARRRRRCVAAALVLHHPGRVGFLFYPPVDGGGVDGMVLAEVVRAASGESLDAGLRFVQALADPGSDAEVEFLVAGGYEFLAELIYMELDLSQYRAPRIDRPRECRRHGQFDEAELGALIRETYRGSLDCPLLVGVRDMADVLASHKSSGEFQPEHWWIVQEQGRPAGCILVNAAGRAETWDVVYVGVHPEHRGRGLGREMLRRAACAARARGARRLTLAADARNGYAMDIYEGEGFREVRRRIAMVDVRRGMPSAEEAKRKC